MLTIPAELSLHIHRGLLGRLDGDLGGSTDVSSCKQWARKRRAITLWPSVSFFGLINGGFAGLIWTYVAVFTGFIFVYASMAELASMYEPRFPAACIGLSRIPGLRHPADNTIGCPNLLRENIRDF